MNYQETIDYLFSRLPMFSRIGTEAFKKDLTNIKILCEQLGDPHLKFKSIHVAGTNGKGSVSHMLAAIFQTEGYKSGLYTSPHLKDFRERIKINGKMVPEEFVIEFVERIRQTIEKIEPSFFEITVALAFEYFAQQKVDIAVIEVGLGGRLDSTNILIPQLSVITNIGLDHMNMLGDSVEKIAFEKAGIIKQAVPVIIGEASGGILEIFKKIAAEKQAPIFIASENKQVTEWKWEKNELVVEVATKNKTDRQVYHLDLIGLYQTKNILTVLETVSQMQQKGWLIKEASIKKALQRAKKMTGLHGRWDVIHRHPIIVLDVAHNEDGIRQVVKQIEIIDPNDLHIIIGLVKDKEVDAIFELLPDRATYYFTEAHIPRALNSEILKHKASVFGLKGKIYQDVNNALYDAISAARKDDLILVCGSVFLIAEVNTEIHHINI